MAGGRLSIIAESQVMTLRCMQQLTDMKGSKPRLRVSIPAALVKPQMTQQPSAVRHLSTSSPTALPFAATALQDLTYSNAVSPLPLRLQPLAGSISLPSILKAQRPGTLTLVVSSILTMSGVLEPGMLKKLVIFPPLKPA